MRKVVLTYGLLAGIIVAALMVIGFAVFGESGSYLLGYATMIVALSMIFFGIKSYRDNYSGGDITFGRGFQIGLYITIIASVLYVVTWEIYSSIALPNFIDQYAQHSIDALRKSGATDAAILQRTKEMNDLKVMYQNPLYKYGMTFMEIFPVGVVISLISAIILRRKNRLTVSPVSA